jgi:hypothetical protein
MNLLSKKPSNVEISVKRFRPKHLQKTNYLSRFVKVFSATIVVLVASSGMSLSPNATMKAEAASYDPSCPTWPGEDNEHIEFAMLGGMTNAQDAFLSTNGTSIRTYEAIVSWRTFSQQYKDQLQFVRWVPSVEYPSKSMYTSIDEGNGTWGGWRGEDLDDDPNPIVYAGAYDRKNVVNFIDDNGYCATARYTAASSTIFGNMTLGTAKFLYDMVDIIYVAAMGGGINITNVTGLNEDGGDSSNFDSIYQTSEANAESWTRQIADTLELALLGDGTNKGLYETLYLQFLLPLIFIGSIVIIVNLLRTKAVKALTGIVWMIVTIILGTLLLQSPMAIPKFVDGVVGTVANTAASAITSADESELCNIPDNPDNQADVEARKVSCKIWEETVFAAWKKGQFGTSEISNTEAANFVQYVYSPKLNEHVYNLSRNPAYNDFFTGSGSFTSNGFLAIIALLSIGFFTASMGLLLLAYQVSMLLLIFTAPFFFLVGISPSATGKGVFLRWFELIISLLVKRLVVTILLAVFLKMFFIVSGIGFDNILMQSVIFAIVAYIGITQRSKIIEMFTGRINFGGDKSITVGGALETVADKSAVVAMGAAAAGAAVATKKTIAGASSLTVGAAKAGTNSIRGAYAERKLQKMKESGASQQEREEYLQDRIDKLGSRFGSNFVGADGNISLKAWEEQIEVKQQTKITRAEERNQEVQTRRDARKAQTILDKERRGIDITSEEQAFAADAIRRRAEIVEKKQAEKTSQKIAKNISQYTTEEARQQAYERQIESKQNTMLNPKLVNENSVAEQLASMENAKARKRAQKSYRRNGMARRAAHNRAFNNDYLDGPQKMEP